MNAEERPGSISGVLERLPDHSMIVFRMTTAEVDRIVCQRSQELPWLVGCATTLEDNLNRIIIIRNTFSLLRESESKRDGWYKG